MLDQIATGVKIASGISGLFGKKKKTPSLDSQYATSTKYQKEYQDWVWANQAKSQVAGAKAAGLHPLFAMGQAPQMQSPTLIDGQSDNIAGSLGQIGSAITDYQQGKSDKLILQKQLEQYDADIAYKKALTANANADAIKAATVASSVATATSPTSPVRAHTLPDLTPSKDTTQAEVIEQEYGGAVGEIYGLNRFLGDIGRKIGSWWYGAQQDVRQSNKKKYSKRNWNKFPTLK